MSSSEDPSLLPPTLQPFRDRLVVALDRRDQALEHPRFIDALELCAPGLPGKPAGDIHNVAHATHLASYPQEARAGTNGQWSGGGA